MQATCEIHGVALILSGCNRCGAPQCCPVCCKETTDYYLSQLRTYYITAEVDGVLHPHKVEAFGIAQAVDIFLKRFGYGTKVLSVVDATEQEPILEAADKVANAGLNLLLQPGNRDYEDEMHKALDDYAAAHGEPLSNAPIPTLRDSNL